MSSYTNTLTAEQLIHWIAHDYVELSHDKVLWQRNDHMKACKNWLKENIPPEPESLEPKQDIDF
jgi:hypothetical protein